MREKIDYYFSLISPWAYLGHATFMELAATNGLDVTFKPIFLQSVFDETGGLVLAKRHPARQNYRWFELQRWRDKRALPLTLKPRYFPCDPRLADKTAIALITAGHDPDAFIRAAFSAVWAEDRNIADPAVLADMSAKLQKDGTINLEDLKGLSEEDMKASVAALNLKPVQFNKLFKAVSNL